MSTLSGPSALTFDLKLDLFIVELNTRGGGMNEKGHESFSTSSGENLALTLNAMLG